jgi:branched-chain amino acid transport system substrate-binding protein
MTAFAIGRRAAIAGGAAAAGAASWAPRARAAGAPLRIGVINDQSGPYADLAGPGSVVAARLAAADAMAAGLGRQVEVLVGDHQNKPDVGLGIIREWFSAGGVMAAVDIANSAISLGAQPLAVQYDKILAHVSSTTSDLVGKGCAANGFQWAQNTYADSNGLMRSLLRSGKKTFYFITVDYAFGHAVENDARHAIEGGGGRVLGSAKHPLNTSDFGSFLTQASASGAEVVVLANSGGDLISSVKQAGEFGLGARQLVVAPIVYLTDVHALGLRAAQGLQFIQSWYWDRDDRSRTWARRFFAERRRMPTDLQAGVYSATLHILRAVQSAGSDETAKVIAAMRATPVDDMYTQGARISANNKLMLNLLLARVKAPEQSHAEWDYLDVVAPVPAGEAFRAPAESGCPLVKA